MARTKRETRKLPAESVESQLEVVAAASIELRPTRALDERAREIFQMILDTRGQTTWKPYELHVATDLAELNAKIEWVKETIEIEGDLSYTRGGVASISPRVTLVHVMQREALAISRALGLTAGQRSIGNKDERDRAEIEAEMARAAKQSNADPLLA